MVKKYFLVFILVSFQITDIIGQKPSVANVEEALSKKELEKAKNQAEQILENQIAGVKTKNDKFRAKGKKDKIKPEVGKSETYVLLGRIYSAIALSDNPSHSKFSDNPVKIAMDNFNKIKELEKESSYIYLDVFGPTITGKQPYIDELYSNLFNKGIEAYNSDNMTKALSLFEKVILVNPSDTNSYINAMAAAVQIGDKEKSKQYTRKIIDIGRRDIPYYIYLIDVAIEEENYQEALDIIKEAKNYFPENAELIKKEINIYTKTEEADKAIASLKEVMEKEPDNPLFPFYLGILYDNAKNTEEAEKYYKKSISLDNNQSDANYNLGALYYNAAVKIGKELNNMEINIRTGAYKEKERAKSLQDQIKEKYKLALPNFEKVIEIDDEKLEAWEVLAVIYKALKMNDKLEIANQKLKHLR